MIEGGGGAVTVYSGSSPSSSLSSPSKEHQVSDPMAAYADEIDLSEDKQ